MSEVSHEAVFMAEIASRSVFWTWVYKMLIHRMFRELSKKEQCSLAEELAAICVEESPVQ